MALTGKPSSSTVTQPVGSQTAPSIRTRSGASVRRVTVTVQTMADPKAAAQALHAMQENLLSPIQSIGDNPTLQGVLVKGVVLVGGTAKVVSHSLGRAYVGFWCAGTHGVSWTGFATDLPTASFSGLTASQAIVLTNPSSGTFDFWIF